MNKPIPSPRARHVHGPARGMTLIDVLVVVLIFSFGLLGMVGLQARAVQFSVSADDTNRAALLANELSAAMWNNNSANVAPAVVTAWQARVADATNRGLPNGVGAVTVDANVATITVQWVPPGQPADKPYRYITSVLIPATAVPPP